ERNLGGIDIVGVNDLTDAQTLAHLFKFDSIHGKFPGEISVDGDHLVVNGDRFQVFAERDPSKLPWGDLGADVIIESTGIFRTREKAAQHLAAGAKKVIISAPGSGEMDATIVLGVNDDVLTGDEEVVSNASCTTNCLAPVVKVLMDRFGFRRGFMTTIHSYTNDQALLDTPHKDLRRARAGAVSMIPTTTGAARATSLVLPEVEGRIDGMAIRVPTPDVSLVDLVAEVEEDVSVDTVNGAFREAAEGGLSGILSVVEEPLVSVDFTGHPSSSIVDARSTMVNDGRIVKVLAWYDNEWGYSCRVVDLARYVGERLPASVG
ncbi:MAG: type I glyceraldehyde-3-phosphate dehydrogenase, partial [Gemmatimonadetes bacterium]|nr:type I glyceraldehyde-3-phosphate dehydrogenase [Gemmatimonadota bacterium]